MRWIMAVAGLLLLAGSQVAIWLAFADWEGGPAALEAAGRLTLGALGIFGFWAGVACLYYSWKDDWGF